MLPILKASLFRAANSFRVTWPERGPSPKCTDQEGLGLAKATCNTGSSFSGCDSNFFALVIQLNPLKNYFPSVQTLLQHYILFSFLALSGIKVNNLYVEKFWLCKVGAIIGEKN